MKPWYLRKTTWIGILMVIASAGNYLKEHELFISYPIVVSIIGAVAGVAIIICRQLTERTMRREVEKARNGG